MEIEHEILDKINSTYGEDSQLILKAFEFAKQKHEGQKREDGQEYIVHPYQTAKILIGMNADVISVVCGLLHDCLEDTECTEKEIINQFGQEVANILVGCSKVELIKQARLNNPDENEPLRKMFLCISKDARVAFVKLADRLDNMRNLAVKLRVKQIKIAQETLDIYVPIAERLGMSKLKRELENLCFMYLFPVEYQETQRFMEENYKKREKIIVDISDSIKELAKKHNVEKIRVQSRIKSNFSIFKKQQKKGKDGIYDIVAHRVIVEEVKDCYTMLGAILDKWKPVEGRFKDYIAHPKENFYRSLHITVLYPTDEGEIPFEVQIRTEEMHNYCEYGMAAHWIYKEVGSKLTSGYESNQKMLELKKNSEQKSVEDNAEEFMEIIKSGFYANKIFVFTPKMNVVELVSGSNPIDLAYAIHSGVGNKCVGAKVNGKMVPIDTELKSADVVEIITSATSKGPSKDWLKIVKMNASREKINAFFKKEMREENIKKGKLILDQAAKTKGYTLSSLLNDDWMDQFLDKSCLSTMEEVYAAIGHGSLASEKVINKLISLYEKANKKQELQINKEFTGDRRTKAAEISGLDGIMTKLAKCCNPVPGDKIVGYISRGRGITIHRSDCPVLKAVEKDRLMEIDWGEKLSDSSYVAVIKIIAKNSPSTLASISNKLVENKINISYIYSDKNKDGDAIYTFGIEVKGTQQLSEFINKLRGVKEIYDISR